MDIFAVIAIVWLASAGLASSVGCLRGCADKALTLGILLGPAGFLLTLLLVTRSGRHRQGAVTRAVIYPMQRPGGAAPRKELRRAA
jgi:hypothetical protein